MPFRSKSQVRACYAKGDPDWDCKEWADKTKSIKKLPERIKKAMLESFTKIAKELFDPKEKPPVPQREIINQQIQSEKQQKLQGRTPTQYKREMVGRRRGIVQKNMESAAS